MLVEHLLDLPRVDVVAAANDQVLLPVDDVEVAVLVDPGQVTGVEPAPIRLPCPLHGLGGGLGALPVAFHHVRPADDDLADLTLRDLVVFAIHDAHPHVPDGRADRAGLALAAGMVERGDRRGFPTGRIPPAPGPRRPPRTPLQLGVRLGRLGAPPVSLEPRWLGPHVGYTIAKYGMTLCPLGFAAEFAQDGIASNALWPRTLIATAAVLNLLGGDEAIARARKPELYADAA
jgi:hypothetical protein